MFLAETFKWPRKNLRLSPQRLPKWLATKWKVAFWSQFKKTILVTGEMFRAFFLYAPTNGLKQANTEYKNEKIMMRKYLWDVSYLTY